MIQKLPNDIIDIIINTVGKNSIKSIIITKDYNYVKKIAAKRISLWYKILSRSICCSDLVIVVNVYIIHHIYLMDYVDFVYAVKINIHLKND
jgi:hypothetical protein